MVFALLALLGAWFLWKRQTPGLKSYDLLLAWVLKLGASLVLISIYTDYYGWGSLTADPEEFMYEGRLLANVAKQSVPDYLKFLFGLENKEMMSRYLSTSTHWSAGELTIINDSKSVIRVNSVIALFSGGSLFIHCAVFGFFSLLGFRELYLTFQQRIEQKKRIFWYGLILIPSLIFWTASMLKEPLMIVGLCLVIRAAFSELALRKRIVRFVLGGLLLLAFKPYVLLCLIPALTWYFLSLKWSASRKWASLVILPFAAILLLLVMPAKKEKLVTYLTRKQFDFINLGRGGLYAYADTCFFYFRPDQFSALEFRNDREVFLKRPITAKLMETGKVSPFRNVYLQPNTVRWYEYYRGSECSSYIPVTEIEGSFGQLMKNIPEAFCNAAFRPVPGDPGGVLKFPAILETIALFGFFIFGLRRWKKIPEQLRWQLLSLMAFSALLFVLIGWTTPVLGAIVRYRIPAYLVIGLSALLLNLIKKPKKLYE